MKTMLARFVNPRIFCIVLMTLACQVFASDENNMLLIHLTNATPEPLHFDRIAGSKPGINFSIDLKTINPGETATITGIKTTNGDLEGYFSFINSSGDTGLLHVLDQEQIHFGQPIFSFNGTKFKSSLISKTRNKNIGPRYLTYIDAELRVISTDIKIYRTS